MLKLVGTTEWMGTHMEVDLRRPSAELVLVVEKLLEDDALEGEEYEYIQIENIEPILYFTPKKGDMPSAIITLEEIS